MDQGKIQGASKVNQEIQAIKKNLDKRKNEMNGIALGICQWKDDCLCYQEKMSILNNEGIRMTLITKHHEPPQAGHSRTAITTKLIGRQYNWPNIREDIKQFIKNYDTCESTKVVRHAPYGLLESNEAPDRP